MNLTLYQLSYFALPKEVPYPSVGISILYVGYPLRGHIIQSQKIFHVLQLNIHIESIVPLVILVYHRYLWYQVGRLFVEDHFMT